MLKRLVICVLNVVFPPFAVMMLTGMNEDVFFNCILFLLAIIPSHVHGFYISLTYFNRKRNVRKGVYPGPPRRLIWSEKVNNGGASRRQMQELLDEKEGRTLTKRVSRKLTNKIEGWNDGNSEKFTPESPLSGTSRLSTRRSRRYNDYDDYEGARLSQRSSRRAY